MCVAVTNRIAGRIAVFGGCEDYTGAPYFSASSAALFGCDLTHVVCARDAANVIKCYSPNLMVHPYLYESANVPEHVTGSAAQERFISDTVMPKVAGLIARINVAIIGPGLGRDELMLRVIRLVIAELRNREIPMVIDADGLFLVSQDPHIVKGAKNVILTPNVVEFKRISSSLQIDDSLDLLDQVKQVSAALGVTVVHKGESDLVVNGEHVLKNSVKGSNKRVGGQGDTLTGIIGTMVSWGHNNYTGDLTEDEIQVLACYAGCTAARVAQRLAFDLKKRSMQTTDVHEQIGAAYEMMFGESKCDELFS